MLPVSVLDGADGPQDHVLPVVTAEFAVSNATDGEFPGDAALAAGDTLAVGRHRDVSAVGTHLGEPFGDEVDEITATEIGDIEPPEFAYAHSALIVHRQPRAVVEDAKRHVHTVLEAAVCTCISRPLQALTAPLTSIDRRNRPPSGDFDQISPCGIAAVLSGITEPGPVLQVGWWLSLSGVYVTVMTTENTFRQHASADVAPELYTEGDSEATQ